MADTCRLYLLGPLSVIDADGVDRTPSSAKDRALLAMIATAPSGRRGRAWLKDRLWSTKPENKSSASLRQSIYGIRRALGPFEDLIQANASVVWVDKSRLSVDVDDPDLCPEAFADAPDFLEGMDIDDPEFEEWLRDHRSYWHEKLSMPFEEDLPKDPLVPAQPNVSRSPIRSQAGLVSASPDVGRLLENPDHANLLRFAVAVLPLQNKTGSTGLTFFSDGFSEDLIERLSKLRWLPVIARSSSFAVKSHKRDLVAVSDTLKARYVMDGDVSLNAETLCIRLFLNNMDSGASIWCESYEVAQPIDQGDLEYILREVVSQIGIAIDMAEQSRSMSDVAQGASYSEHLWRGRWHLGRLTAVDSQMARNHLDLALQSNPGAPEVMMQDGQWHLLRLWSTRGAEDEIRFAQRLMRRAHRADPSDARGYAMLGMTELWLGDHDTSAGLFAEAIQRNPSFAKAHEQLGSCLLLMNRPEAAIASLEEAVRLSPNDQHLFFLLGELAMSHFMKGFYLDARRYAAQALIYRPKFWYAHMIRMAACDALGDHVAYEKARQAFQAEGLRLTQDDFDWIPFQDPIWAKMLASHANL